jgi:hypothetical protein
VQLGGVGVRSRYLKIRMRHAEGRLIIWRAYCMSMIQRGVRAREAVDKCMNC